MENTPTSQAANQLLLDAFTRIADGVEAVLDSATAAELGARLDPDANSIAWLSWHLSRVQDDHVAEIAGTEQIWIAQDWVTRFDLPLPAHSTGFGHSAQEVASLGSASGADLAGYHRQVHTATRTFVQEVTADDLHRIVDESWDPPVTLGARLVSVIGDGLSHLGQAQFISGVLARIS